MGAFRLSYFVFFWQGGRGVGLALKIGKGITNARWRATLCLGAFYKMSTLCKSALFEAYCPSLCGEDRADWEGWLKELDITSPWKRLWSVELNWKLSVVRADFATVILALSLYHLSLRSGSFLSWFWQTAPCPKFFFEYNEWRPHKLALSLLNETF